jgi:ribonuclease I
VAVVANMISNERLDLNSVIDLARGDNIPPQVEAVHPSVNLNRIEISTNSSCLTKISKRYFSNAFVKPSAGISIIGIY